MNEKKKFNVSGQINHYLKWPLYFSLFWVAIAILVCFINIKAGVITVLATIVFTATASFMLIKFYPKAKKYLVDFGSEYSQIQRQMLHDMELPYGLIDNNGKILWTNTEMDDLAAGRNIRNKNITSIFKGITEDKLKIDDGKNEGKREFRINHEDRVYKISLKKFALNNSISGSEEAEAKEDSGLISIYFFDETLIQHLTKDNKNERMISGLIYIDNYDEVLQSVEDVRRTLLIALIDRRINKYFAGIDGIVRKLEKDKYFVVVKTKHISTMQSNKFSLLDDVKTVSIGNNLPATISIGFGMGADTYAKNLEYATAAIDMALGRGGDQAVLKDGAKIYYYGGKSRTVEKNTRVKARVKAHALRELIETRDKVFIMGHHIGDNDSFGAAIGLFRAAKTMGKKTYIVMGEMSTTVIPLLERFTIEDDYEDDLFVSGPEATALISKEDMLIVVDCNRAEYTEYPDLVKKAQTIIVMDHHRQSADVIDNAQLSYIEPYSSSTCEMVTEIMQYVTDGVKLKPQEADAIYSGIMIDTNNFTNRTGVRTFEAAAYLRRSGADVVRVRKMFRDDMADYKAKAQAIQNAEIFMNDFAISECPSAGVKMPTVVGAQAANELLNIKGIKASIVCTMYNEEVYLSARSIDEINVQLIMEKLGGGGHMNLAGAQIRNCTCEQAKVLIKEVIQEMNEEGEL